MSPYRSNAIVVHREVKPANVFERVRAWFRTMRRRWLVSRGGTWRERFVRCSLCGGPLESRGFTNTIRRQMPNAQHLHYACEPRRTMRTLELVHEGRGDEVSAHEMKRALAQLAHMGRVAKAYPDFMPASAEARRKILEMYGARAEAEIPPGDFRTVNELRQLHGFGPLSQLSPKPRAGDGSDDPWREHIDDLSDRTGANRHTDE